MSFVLINCSVSSFVFAGVRAAPVRKRFGASFIRQATDLIKPISNKKATDSMSLIFAATPKSVAGTFWEKRKGLSNYASQNALAKNTLPSQLDRSLALAYYAGASHLRNTSQ